VLRVPNALEQEVDLFLCLITSGEYFCKTKLLIMQRTDLTEVWLSLARFTDLLIRIEPFCGFEFQI